MTRQLQIDALGTLTIRQDGEPVHGFGSRTAEALLIYAAFHRQPLSRQLLAEFFWDEREPGQALANLRAVLSMLRKRLPDHLIIDRHSVAFDHSSDYLLDALVLEEQLSAMDGPLSPGDLLNDEERHLLQTVLELYRGDFLEGFYLNESRGFEEWTVLKRERLRHLARMGLRRLVQDCLERGDYRKGRGYARRLLSLDPLDESGQRQMMLLLARDGQRNAALQQYHSCRQLLAEELGASPAPATTALYERLSATSIPPPHNLPTQATPFVGRDAELPDLTRRLTSSGGRLLTILGPGGVGKTRLALEIAHRFAAQLPGRFLEGIYFVELEALNSAAFLATALVEALGLSIRRNDDLRQQLLSHLSQREMLLVLDNFEHLSSEDDGLALLAAILEEAPQVTLLITSRHRLQLPEEEVSVLQGLDYADGDGGDGDGSAASLFIQSARRLQPCFEPSAADRRAIDEVCGLLQGLPLGIELAAGWIRWLDCQAIAQRMAQDLDFAHGRTHNVPQRHRTLRAVFEHSWEMLNRREQTVLQQLAVFRGAFDGEACHAVAGDALAEAAALVDKSLLERLGEDRYRLHPVLREYTEEKLQASGEQPAVEAAFVTYYSGLLAQWEADLVGEEQQQARSRLRQELDNVRAAWQMAAAMGDWRALERGMRALFAFHERQSWFEAGEALMRRAASGLRRATEPQAQTVRGSLLMRQGRFAIYLSRYEQARDLLHESLTLLPEDTADRGLAFAYLGVAASTQGQHERAGEYAGRGLAIFRALQDQTNIAYCLNLLGVVALKQGQYERARELQEENAAIRRAGDDAFNLAVALNNLGSIAQATADYGRAGQLYQRVYETFREMDHQAGMAAARTNAGYVAWKEGAYEKARQLQLESLELREALDDQRGMAITLTNLGEVARSAGDRAEAASYFRRALSLALSLSLASLAMDILAGVAAMLLDEGQAARALTLLATVQQEPASSGETMARAETLMAEAGEQVTRAQRDAALQAGAALSWQEAATQVEGALVT
ncbi:MAG TPA: tetratricopeptide repeat protein [Candidatus Sulfomarinibacteraceae bacterium]|nr:tetratricopeptide repeat protein [Candidatus Sulfomarinibacteraceae bacterium]